MGWFCSLSAQLWPLPEDVQLVQGVLQRPVLLLDWLKWGKKRKHHAISGQDDIGCTMVCVWDRTSHDFLPSTAFPYNPVSLFSSLKLKIFFAFMLDPKNCHKSQENSNWLKKFTNFQLFVPLL